MMPEWTIAIRQSVRTEIFQVSFVEPFRVVFFYTLILLEAMCLAYGLGEELWLMLGVVPLLTGVLSSLAIGVICWRYKFSVGPEGLACYDFWCQPLHVDWDSISHVTRFSMLGLRYLRIASKHGGKEVWLPLFVTRFASLRELITIYAGENRLLADALQADSTPLMSSD